MEKPIISTIESAREMGFKIADLEIHNWLGLLGAISAYYFIFRWLGIKALFLYRPCFTLLDINWPTKAFG